MIGRKLLSELHTGLKNFPAVAILGARQTGKTTIAKTFAKSQKKQSLYLDLENPYDMDKLEDAYTFLEEHKTRIIIIDEMQRKPELFSILRSLIDNDRKPGRFLLLGSASPHLVKGVSESLAGRIQNLVLNPVNLVECAGKYPLKKHWFRGGFPDILTAKSDALFCQRMDAFISSFIERDLPNMFGISLSNTIMRRFWQMLAYSNGSIWNAHDYSRSLGVSAPTVSRYFDLLEGSFMIHRLPAFYFNARKRIIKSPKIYLRDTGIMHRLLRISGHDDLQGHPALGASWEAYVVEQICQLKDPGMDMFYYRTQNGAETDVLLTKAGIPVSCIEIKYSNKPDVHKGFYQCIQDLNTQKNFIITPGSDTFNKTKEIKICSLESFLNKLLSKIK